MGEMSTEALVEEKERLSAIVAAANPRANAGQVRMYVDSFIDYRTAQENIDANGTIVFHPRTGAPIANPYLPIRAAAMAAMLKLGLRADALWTP